MLENLSENKEDEFLVEGKNRNFQVNHPPMGSVRMCPSHLGADQ